MGEALQRRAHGAGLWRWRGPAGTCGAGADQLDRFEAFPWLSGDSVSDGSAPDVEIVRRINDLKEQTQRFWGRVSGSSIEDQRRTYVEKLLADEMALAGARGRLPHLSRLPGGQCETLVLLVGFSHEPLLQSISAFRPRYILPVLNRSYGTRTDVAMREVVEDGVRHLKRVGLLGECQVRPCEPLAADDPATVFRFLLRELGTAAGGRSTVVDITGGKKSMVAGAFFFAAYTNVAISYVDFDDYDEAWRRPYGCTCRIDFITNPYRDFQLRDWALVQRAYEQYRFAAASDALEGLLDAMRAGGYFESRQVDAARRLASVLDVYGAWDNGDHRTALRELRSLPDELRTSLAGKLPDAIVALGEPWPHAGDGADAAAAAKQLLDEHRALELGDPAGENTFYMRMPLLTTYVRDELQKVRRLVEVKEDYRAALVRADGLVEVLLAARLFVLWKEGSLVVEVDRALPRGNGRGREALRDPETRALADLLPEQRRALYEALTEDPGEPVEIVMALRWRSPRGTAKSRGGVSVKRRLDAFAGGLPDPTGATTGRGPEGNKGALAPRVAVRARREELRKFWSGTGLSGVNELRRLRNKAAHTYLPIPRSVAEAAWAMADACWKDFVEAWLSRAEPGFTPPGDLGALPWAELCTACGIDFLPPYRTEDS